MADKYEALAERHIDFIRAQHIFFVGTAGAEGYVNVSPKGRDCLRVVGATEVLWLNLTGSGNETAAHVLENHRMTLMFCSFDKQPLILRLYGDAQAIHPRDREWGELLANFPDHAGARQIFRLRIRMVQTSCGYAVPHLDFVSDRTTLQKWAENRGPSGVQQYWADKNVLSLDGKETGILG
jgi:predicted pyridoxine 5'-phosphate oxidase superfamily flavin-nucleotide-binding protein